jgi:hypothetical protein
MTGLQSNPAPGGFGEASAGAVAWVPSKKLAAQPMNKPGTLINGVMRASAERLHGYTAMA